MKERSTIRPTGGLETRTPGGDGPPPGQLELAGEQERAARERHTRELTPETEAAHEGRLEELNRLLEAYHQLAQEISQRTGA